MHSLRQKRPHFSVLAPRQTCATESRAAKREQYHVHEQLGCLYIHFSRHEVLCAQQLPPELHGCTKHDQ